MKLTYSTFGRNMNLSILTQEMRMIGKGTIMKKLLSSLSIVSLLINASPLFAAGTSGASFLDIPVGAGPAAMGSAYTSLATNAYAPVWNPAGLARLSGNELAGQHLSYLESIHYEHVSFVHPFAKSRNSDTQRGIGFSIQYLGSGDIERTEVDGSGNYVPTNDSFNSYYASYNLAYGQTITDKLALGITGKMISAKLDDVSAKAFAADLGGLYKMNDKIQLGASLVNMGSKLKFISEGDSLPLAFKIGGAFRPSSRYLASSELVYRKDGPTSVHFGGQWRPLEAISLRVGYKTDTLKELGAMAGVTTGMGLHVWGQELAYAWSPYGDLGSTHNLSLVARFGAEEEQKRNLIQYQKIKKHRTVRSGEQRKQADDMEPEYQQLMQLLADDDSHLARRDTERGQYDR
jgi:hypothetical protein